MASRKYAEGLLGNLDLSFLEEQRGAKTQATGTNWDKLKTRFKNTQELIERERADADRLFNEGQAAIAEQSYMQDRSKVMDLGRRGLLSSGLVDVAEKEGTIARGNAVGNILDVVNQGGLQNIAQLGGARNDLIEGKRDIDTDLLETLGSIGQREGSTKNMYNEIASNIAASKESRDFSKSSSGASSKLNEEQKLFNEQVEKDEQGRARGALINQILSGVDETGERTRDTYTERMKNAKSNVEKKQIEEEFDQLKAQQKLSLILLGGMDVEEAESLIDAQFKLENFDYLSSKEKDDLEKQRNKAQKTLEKYERDIKVANTMNKAASEFEIQDLERRNFAPPSDGNLFDSILYGLSNMGRADLSKQVQMPNVPKDAYTPSGASSLNIRDLLERYNIR